MARDVKVSERPGGIYTQDVQAGPHHIYADEPESFGSADLGMAPFDLVMAGLGACTSITLRMYAERKKWPLEHVCVDVKMRPAPRGDRPTFGRTIALRGDLSAEQRARLMEIANKCPVHRMLDTGADHETVAA